MNIIRMNTAAITMAVLGVCLFFASFSYSQEERAVPVKKYVVEPKMRTVDREWDYFKKIPCDDIHQVVFHSRSEEILLAKRKSQCVNQYKAFLPTPIKR